MNAVRALGKIGSFKAVSVVIKRLLDSNSTVRYYAADNPSDLVICLTLNLSRAFKIKKREILCLSFIKIFPPKFNH
ncbi:MAG: hypothetical protein A2Y98_00890 [Candidatus Portnoybacteria bacterium RBG_19FT_COMBO_36_7]|uniref:Uncharacterized protein n=1 Tax=Candidatus Portnoybacteria bacterium RBG_19FT_COMBO_36_7 TaxID=1801992 RepID=A0A1G2F7N2_9BACT|nr:MAG: hypothetical protein A2Y98_00890 [Candidatus Portnoybacteria bacterium RBG_19FT_COMBO_36_7]